MSTETWKVQVFGERCARHWEISVVREDNNHGQASWGWFDETPLPESKVLISHNGPPCNWPINGFVWDEQLRIAEEVCRRLNAWETVAQ